MTNPNNNSLIKFTRLSDVTATDISWLWKPYIPSGKLTILEGDPEAGKTFLSLEIAAHVTTGRSLPAYGIPNISEPGEAANVIFLGAEDDLADTIRPRFETANGDPSRFIAIEGVIKKDDKNNIPLALSLSDIELLDTLFNKYKPALLIVDPFQAFIGSKVDFHRANEIRPIMAGLKRLAERQNCAILLIRHLAKAAYGKALYQGMGSIDILAAARSVLVAGVNHHPESGDNLLDPETGGINFTRPKTPNVLAQSKCNIAVKGPSISYGIENGKLHFGPTVEITADQLTAPAKIQDRPRQRASDFLHEQLVGGAVESTKLYGAAAKQSIGKSTLDRAAKALGAIRRPSGFGGTWEISLPLCPVESSVTDSISASQNGSEDSVAAEDSGPLTDESAGTVDSGQCPSI